MELSLSSKPNVNVVDEPMTANAPATNPSEQLLAHWQGVYLLSLRITDDAHAAEDIVQDAYIRALQRLDKDRLDNPRTWLYSIAANLARNWLRDRSTHRRLEKTMAAEKSALSSTPATQPDDSVVALRQHFKGLEEKYRTALSLHYEQGLTYREVAAVLQKPEGTAASLITRGLDLLRQSLAGDGHTIAPALLALELQKWAASAAARPELLTALKSALAAKSIAGAATATAAATKGGATLLTGKTLLAGGVLITAALVFTATQIQRAPAAPAPMATPVVPVSPVIPAAGNAAAPSRKARYFNSALSLSVSTDVDGVRKELGRTPWWTESGIRLPDDGIWEISANYPNPPAIEQVLAEVRAAEIPGVDLSSLDDATLTPTIFSDLASISQLKSLTLYEAPSASEKIAALKKLHGLERLKIHSGKSTDELIAAAASLPELTDLALPGNISTAAAMPLMKLTKLKSFSGRISRETLAQLAQLPALERIDIRESEVSASDILANPQLLPKNVKTLSLGNSQEKLQKREELRKLLPHVSVNGWNALADEPPGQKSLAEEAKDTLIAMERADHDASAVPSADPEIKAVLTNRKISFEFVDVPIAQAITQIADHSETVIIIDPVLVDSNSPSLVNINLRVSEMSCDLALDWILRLSNLEKITIGRTLVVMDPKRVHQLTRPETRKIELPAEPNECPWTQAETEAIASTIRTWSLDTTLPMKADHLNGFKALNETPCTVLGPGKIDVIGVETGGCAEFLNGFAEIPSRAMLPLPIQTALAKLEEPLQLTPPAKRPTILEGIELLNKAASVKLMVDPKVAAMDYARIPAPDGWPGNAATGKDALIALCNAAKLSLDLDEGILITKSTMTFSVLHPTLLDLRPALKAGTSEAELVAALADVAKQGVGLAPVVIRGRWLSVNDPVTARRAMAVIDEAAKSGKIAVPPLPWYCELAKNGNVESPKPPKPVDDYNQKGY